MIPTIQEDHGYAGKYHCRVCNRAYQRKTWRSTAIERIYLPIDNPNREELAWAAGFYDGEGNCWASAKTGVLKIAVSQADPRPLRRFHAAVLRLGKLDGPYLRPHRVHRENHSEMWTWHAQNYEDFHYVIGWLWEFLSEPKREQIDHYVAIYHTRPHLPRVPQRAGHFASSE